MINLRFNKPGRRRVTRFDSSYSRNFSLALLNWERNRQETRFAFSTFDPDQRKVTNKKFANS